MLSHLRRLLRSAVFLAALSTPSFGQHDVQSERPLAEHMFERLLARRLDVTYAQLHWSVDIVRYAKVPTLEGCRYEYRGWYDFTDSRVRVELTQSCPLDAHLCFDSRFAYADRTYLIIHRDEPDMAGDELQITGAAFMRSPDALTLFDLYTDPRLIGLLSVRFTLLKNYTPDELVTTCNEASDHEVTQQLLDGRRVLVIQLRNRRGGKNSVTYWLDPTVDDHPVRILSHADTAAGQLTDEVQTTWKPVADESRPQTYWIPAAMTCKRWLNGELVSEERLVMKEARIGNAPDASLFTWNSMRIPDGFVVRVRNGVASTVKQWNADTQRFGEWKPVILKKNLPQRPAALDNSAGNPGHRRNRTVLIAANLLGIVILLGYALSRRAQPGKDDVSERR